MDLVGGVAGMRPARERTDGRSPNSGGERTEEPSQRRLDQARERGQVPRSRELTNFATMIGGSAALVAVGGTLVGRMSHIMHNSLTIDPRRLERPGFDDGILGRSRDERALGHAAHIRRP